MKIVNSNSDEQDIKGSVPQGSVLGPFLYNIYTSDIPHLKTAEIAIFADDTSIYAGHVVPRKIVKNLQLALNEITEWMNKWKLQLNVAKTEAVFFTESKKKYKIPNLEINKTQVQWSKEAKYLGLWLDKELNFKKHFQETKRKANGILHKLYPLLCRKRKVSLINKILLYKQLVRPILTYGIEIWSMTDEKSYNILQIIQNKILRMATDAPYYISNEQLHNELEIETLYELANKFVLNTQSDNPLIQDSCF